MHLAYIKSVVFYGLTVQVGKGAGGVVLLKIFLFSPRSRFATKPHLSFIPQ